MAYSEEELGSLSAAQRDRLALLTAFGSLAAEGRLESLAGLLAEVEGDSMVLEWLGAESALERAGFTTAEREASYLRDPAPELVVRHLVVLSERWRSAEHRDQARAEALRAARRIEAGEDFAAVAGEVSEEPGATERGGLLEPGREGDWVPEFWGAAEDLSPGEVSGVVETRYGYHVLRLEERRPIPFAEVRRQATLRQTGQDVAWRTVAALADSAARDVVVDRDAVAELRDDDVPGTTTLARWPGDSLSVRRFARRLAGLPPEDWAALREAEVGTWVDAVREAAVRERLLLEGGRRGLVIVEGNPSGEWRTSLDGWRVALGFEEGLEPDAVKQAALAGLVSDQQGAVIARREVEELAAALHVLVTFPRATGQGRGLLPSPRGH